MQIGIDDEGGQYGVKFYQSRHNEAARLIGGHGNVLDARAFLRKGCPPSLRGCMW
jgi:predicted RNA-binding protein Jag